MVKKKLVLNFNFILLGWFFLDMIGIYFNNSILVTRSYKEDGIFFIIFLVTIILFTRFEKFGKYILSLFLTMWFVVQIYSHWYFTIFGPWEGLNNYFHGTIKLIHSNTIYVPDLYHIVLHLLILLSLILSIKYSLSKNSK